MGQLDSETDCKSIRKGNEARTYVFVFFGKRGLTVRRSGVTAPAIQSLSPFLFTGRKLVGSPSQACEPARRQR